MPALGIDVGGTSIKVRLAGAAGRRLVSTTLPASCGVDVLVSVVAEQVARGRGGVDDLEGIGVVVPGIVDETTGTAALSANLGCRAS